MNERELSVRVGAADLEISSPTITVVLLALTFSDLPSISLPPRHSEAEPVTTLLILWFTGHPTLKMSSLENRVGKLSVRGDQDGALGDVTADRVNTLAPTWKAIKPVAYDYSVYNASGPEEREAAERGIAERLAAEAQAAAEADQFTSEIPLWASGAAKYEWKEEYGDIGPPHPELEKQLFKDQFINRIGPQFNVSVLHSMSNDCSLTRQFASQLSRNQGSH